MEHSHDLQRPNRSDAHLSVEEEARMEAETRHHFDDLAPKRHSKPQRSDYSSAYLDKNTASDAIPEYAEFQRLEGHEEKLEYSSEQVGEEFVETDYYKDLNSVGKQHHTTGTGFIKVENENRSGYDMKEAGVFRQEQKPEYSSEQVEEEFVETDYYKDLNSVGNQHHTTGTGFIKVENVNGNGYHMKEAGEACSHSASCLDGACHGNPATNDWIPASSEREDFVSGKPSRSDI